ncbi:MAG TPA: ATP-binding protein, partial [Kofleriaceae bacterium]|nr:ATP-binding protein [Kofleriaceae bacterium]
MGILGDIDDVGPGGRAVPFKRHFLLPGVLMTGAELLLVVLPMLSLFAPGESSPSTLLRIAIPVLAGAVLVWWAAMTSWLSPVQRGVMLRRRGKRLPTELHAAAYRATWKVPLRALILRTVLWTGIALIHGLFLARYADWADRRVVALASLTALHAFAINTVRAVWYAVILGRVRERLFSGITPVRRFADGYFGRLVLIALVVCGATLAGVSAFLFYFLPITHEQYLQIGTYFPIAAAIGLVGWVFIARRFTREIDAYLAEHAGGVKPGATPDATSSSVYRRAQSLPYRLALTSLVMWVVIGGVGAVLGREHLRFEMDDAILMLAIALVIALGAAIYESLWYRETMRTLLAHLTVRHRLPVRGLKPAMSLRTKLLLSFGGVVLVACGLALFWSFVQYKNQATDYVSKQAELGLAWLRSEVQATTAGRTDAPDPAMVRDVLDRAGQRSPEATAVYYYLSPEPESTMQATGGGPMGAPRLPWYAIAQMRLLQDENFEVGSLDLAGRHGHLLVSWHGRVYDLGTVAVFFPSYRGRGPSIVRPLKELMVFFLVLFGVCAGIVLLTVAQFVTPIRLLEERADGMARGELAEPVSSGAEGDEIGRLTFALEEMRRALREKLRSTEEVNLDLERAVQRRTADLAKKNRELAETLDKLTRAQDQLVRSEKMASIGQLVAGIAHEINNPVNAIVNTVGPLEETLDGVDSPDLETRREAAADLRDMVRVIQRGAHRTKDIVRALHNYSRTDDESVVEFDLNRGLDESLDLLRHIIKNIEVVRDYGNVGRVRGHAGQLNQVFVNLLANAAQAVAEREGATIWLQTAETEDRNGSVVIVLRDNGPGIPPEVLPRIFDPFFTTKDVGEGSGLGLSIVHGIVERHGGTIEVESEVGV